MRGSSRKARRERERRRDTDRKRGKGKIVRIRAALGERRVAFAKLQISNASHVCSSAPWQDERVRMRERLRERKT